MRFLVCRENLLDFLPQSPGSLQREVGRYANAIEKEGILNYLDIKIIRTEKGKFERTVYRKTNSISEIANNRCKTSYGFKIAALRAYFN